MMTRAWRFAAALACALVAGSGVAWSQGVGGSGSRGVGPGVVGAQAGGAGCAYVNCTPLSLDKRGPLATDDVTAGITPGTVWRGFVNGSWHTWKNMSAAINSATWNLEQDLPWPGDVIGLFVSAATVNAGGSGYVANEVLTLQGGAQIKVLTVTAGAVTTLSIQTPNLLGVCVPTITAASVLVTSGAGTGATFNLTVLSPVINANRRDTVCYTGSILQVQRSDNAATLNVGYLADGELDYPSIAAFAAGRVPMAEYTAYTSGPVPGVSIWNDQGGTAKNATQPVIIQQPVIFAGRLCGKSPCITFHSQGGSTTSAYPAVTQMVIPAFTIDAANSTVSWMGGAITPNSAGISYLNQATGGGSNFFGLAAGTQSICLNAAGAGSMNTAFLTMIPETPSVYQCSFIGGYGYMDSTFMPAQQSTVTASTAFFPIIASGTVTAGVSTISITVATGALCNLAANRTVTYTATAADAAAADTYAAMVAGVIAAINNDTGPGSMQQAGVTAGISPRASSHMAIFEPVSGFCSPSSVGGGGMAMSQTTIPGGAQTSGTFSGGFLGKNPLSANTGLSYMGFNAFIPWAMNPLQLSALRASIGHWHGLVPQPGAVIVIVGASNMSGYLTPFLQDGTGDLPRLLGRPDIALFNPAVAGQQLTSIDSTFWTTTYAPILKSVHASKPSNNWVIIDGEVNSLINPGTPASEMAAMQSIAGKAHALGFKALCAPSALVSVTTNSYWNGGSLNTQMAAFRALLNASPGNCDIVVDQQALPVLGSIAGPWPQPWFDGFDGGTHMGPAGNALQTEMFANALRSQLQ